MEELMNTFNSLTLNNAIAELRRDFVLKVNEKQRQAVYKVLERYDSHKMYLTNSLESSSQGNLEIELYGGLNPRSKKREKYKVCLNSDRTLTCNCKDFTFRCRANNIVCKHIVFIVCKVGDIYDPVYFETKKLREGDFHVLVSTLSSRNCWENSEWALKSVNGKFKKSKKELNKDDSCPICYDELGNELALLNCPDCNNYVHEECVRVWMQYKKRCVYCRKEWSDFNNEILL